MGLQLYEDLSMNQMKLLINILLLLGVLFAATACTTLKKSDDPTLQNSSDPFVGLNRKFYALNNTADKAILRPIAKTYDAVLPDPVQNSVSHFFSNLGEPFNIANNLLQGKADGAMSSTYRFVVNSTVGVFGLFDVANSYGVNKKPEDFGQTLASWGVKPGPYLMIPFWGPSNLRDAFGLGLENGLFYPINELTDDSFARAGATSLNIVDTRAHILGADEIIDRQLDPYLFLKEAYDHSRLNYIYDGNAPEISDDDIDF